MVHLECLNDVDVKDLLNEIVVDKMNVHDDVLENVVITSMTTPRMRMKVMMTL